MTDAYNYQALKIANGVQTFFGLGIGIYSYFPTSVTMVPSAIQCPENMGIVIQNACTRFLNGGGGITHIINDKGLACTESDPGPHWLSFNSEFCPKT